MIEIDPDHAKAHRALGYAQKQGRWARQETLMAENGYKKYKGQWMLPQEIEIHEAKRKDRLAQAEWSQKLKRWQDVSCTRKGEVAQAKIRSIGDQ